MTTTRDTDTRSCNHQNRGRRRWGRRAALTLAVLLGLGGVAYAAGPGLHHGHPHTPEEMQAHVDQMIDHMIQTVDGSAQQKATLKAIAARATPQAEALHGEGRDLKGEIRDLLLADKIDRAALEEARKDAVDLGERASKLAFTSLADAAEALTPAQRRKIADAMARFGR